MLGLRGAGGTFVSDEGCHDATGGTVGGQIGYRWQASQWVFGIEAQGNWADFQWHNESLLFRAPSATTRKIDAFGLFTGQVGYAFNNALLYVKGGAAVTSDRYRRRNCRAPALRSPIASTTPVGVAWSASASNTASPRTGRSAIEYDHMFMQDKTYTFINNGVWRRALARCSRTDRIRQDVDLVTARINYRWGGPVVAKY